MTTLEQPTRVVPIVGRWATVWLFTMQVLIVLTVLALVVMPYYANGLQHENPSYVEGGQFDPKDQWPFTLGAAGSALHLVGYLTFLVGWVGSAALTLMAIGALAAARPLALTRAAVIRAVLTVLIGVGYFCFLFSDFGGHLAAWMAD